MALLLLFSIAIVGKILHTQYSDNGYWKKLSDDLSLVKRRVIAERGNIYTYDGRLLSTTLPTFDLFMDTKANGLHDTIWNSKIDSLCYMLAKYDPKIKDKEQWKKLLTECRKEKKRYVPIAKKLNFETYKAYINFPIFRLKKNKSGLIVQQNNTRKMPFGMLAMRTIGYTRDSGRMRVGLEGRFDGELSGENKVVLLQKVAGGIYMPINEEIEFGAKPGMDIYTTLDINLQDIAEASLYQSLRKSKADYGCVVLLQVKTGAIKAIANLNIDEKHKRLIEGGYTSLVPDYFEDYNHAIGTAAEPGSVIKLASVMSLIDDGHCNENTKVYLQGGRATFYGKTLTDDHPADATVSLSEAFRMSSNVGISTLVNKYFGKNKEKYYQKLEQFHLTKPTGIELQGEASPKIKQPKDWTGISLPWMSIGYEMKLTPLQIVSFYSAVANKGKLMKPYLVREIKDNDQTVEKFEPQVLSQQIAKPETIESVVRMLQGVVDLGTAKDIKSNYSIAGKTGTNRLLGKNGKYQKKYRSTFVGFFPSNQPEYACIVVVNNPRQGDFYGGKLAAPIFKKIADRIYSTDIEIHPSLDQLSPPSNFVINSFRGLKNDMVQLAKSLGWQYKLSDSTSEWVTAVNRNKKMILKPTFVSKSQMPNLKEMSIKDATYLMETMGVGVEIIGRGRIIGQSIEPGQKIYKGSKVKLILG